MNQHVSSSRVAIQQSFSELTIEIRNRRNWLVVMFLSFWLIGWAMGEGFAVQQVIAGDTPLPARLFILFWLTIWSIVGLFVMYIMAMQLAGKEIITLNRSEMRIKKSVLEYGRERHYELFDIENIGYEQKSRALTSRRELINKVGMGAGRGLYFSYRGKTITFAQSAEPDEMRKILEQLRGNPNLREAQFITPPA